ncbi:alpha/beta hydrolase-fold protein, partial [Maribacter dokdonensis]
MKNLIIAILYILLFGAQTTFGQTKTDIIVGNKFDIKSNILNEKRTCLISLPDSYNDSSGISKRYQVIILLDGYTHFKTASGIVHFMSSNSNRNNLMPESIIIAIE